MKFLVGIFVGAILGILGLLSAIGLFLFGIYLGMEVEKSERDDDTDVQGADKESPREEWRDRTDGSGSDRVKVPGPIPEDDPEWTSPGAREPG